MVLFRVFEKVSYGLIVKSSQPIRMNDMATNPVGSLPEM